MLINKNSSCGVDDVVVFKVVTGEEIVAKIVEITDECFIVDRPCTVLPSQQGVGLIQSLICADINIKTPIYKSNIIMYAPVMDDIEKHYLKTTTGLIAL
jgi:hypothetical protein